MAQPDPKPRRRVRLSSSEYEFLSAVVFESQRNRCACGCGHRAHSIHHLIGGQSREDVRENMVALNGDGVRGCHGAYTSKNPVHDKHGVISPHSVAVGIRRHLDTQRPDVVAYILREKGQDWLDEHYPRA